MAEIREWCQKNKVKPKYGQMKEIRRCHVSKSIKLYNMNDGKFTKGVPVMARQEDLKVQLVHFQ